ncbi:MAG TPA: hypothetical protein VNJ52_10055 [Patescibacteria group bacterium]|nr:hypothetical protein [Patescibacteria group bacterium]
MSEPAKVNPQDACLKPVRPLAWADVFSLWREAESKLPHWIEHYTKSGFESWDAWRTNTLKELDCRDLQWSLFEITVPLRVVPSLLGGSFRPWIARYYEGAKHRTFRELAKHPAVRENAIIREMVTNFPKETYLVGLRTERGIIVIEGMHRCCALAIAAENGKPMESRIFIALAEFEGELPEMGRATSPT